MKNDNTKTAILPKIEKTPNKVENDKNKTFHGGTSGAENDKNKQCHGGTFDGAVPQKDEKSPTKVENDKNKQCHGGTFDGVGEIVKVVDEAVTTLRNQLSPWGQAKLMAKLCERVGRGCVPRVAEETGIPKRTLFYLSEIGRCLAPYENLINFSRLEHQTRCLRTLAQQKGKDAELCELAIKTIIDDAQPQNTAETALKQLKEAKTVHEAEAEDWEKRVQKTAAAMPERDPEAVENILLEGMRNSPEASEMQRCKGLVVAMTDDGFQEFCNWLCNYTDKYRAHLLTEDDKVADVQDG